MKVLIQPIDEHGAPVDWIDEDAEALHHVYFPVASYNWGLVTGLRITTADYEHERFLRFSEPKLVCTGDTLRVDLSMALQQILAQMGLVEVDPALFGLERLKVMKRLGDDVMGLVEVDPALFGLERLKVMKRLGDDVMRSVEHGELCDLQWEADTEERTGRFCSVSGVS